MLLPIQCTINILQIVGCQYNVHEYVWCNICILDHTICIFNVFYVKVLIRTLIIVIDTTTLIPYSLTDDTGTSNVSLTFTAGIPHLRKGCDNNKNILNESGQTLQGLT